MWESENRASAIDNQQFPSAPVTPWIEMENSRCPMADFKIP
jgi:hypothetical protein